MADDKSGREKQARDERRRQRERALRTELRRGDEPEPPVDTVEAVERDLDAVEFPATGATVVEAVGDAELAVDGAPVPLADLIPDAGAETFADPSVVRVRIERPTVAGAMKRVAEAVDAAGGPERLDGSQRDAYERTFRALVAVSPDDDDELVRDIADWMVEYVDRKSEPPGSRAVRREAGKRARAAGHQIRNDEWLGV